MSFSKFLLFIFWVFLMVTTACANQAGDYPTALSTAISYTLPTSITSSKSTPLVLPTITLAPTVSPTRTLLPYLSAEHADKVFQQWLSGTSDCLFPCWAGLVPGKTTWEDAVYNLKPVFHIDFPVNDRCDYGVCGAAGWDFDTKDGKHYGGTIYEKEGFLHSVIIGGYAGADFGIKKIFETYGEPSQALVFASPEFAGDPPRLEIVFFFERFKFSIKYAWWAETKKDEFVACGQPELFRLGIVATEENSWTTEEIARVGDQKDDHFILRHRPISDVTSMNTIDLYVLVMANNSDVCISIPVEPWR